MIHPQNLLNPLDREMAWVGVFLRALQEGESAADHLRLRGLGVIWRPDRTPQEREALLAKWPAGNRSIKR
jgi:hypothetical protein